MVTLFAFHDGPSDGLVAEANGRVPVFLLSKPRAKTLLDKVEAHADWRADLRWYEQRAANVSDAVGLQADWFVREVKRCVEIGMPLACCDFWPECSHVLAWIDERDARAKEVEP